MSDQTYDAAIVAVGHKQFIEMGVQGIRALCKAKSIVYDVKSVLARNGVDGRL
jgi:UDP-N-acetyl-D-galactosamine dehydrogenase